MKVIETLRRELEPLNREIAEALRPSREALLSFVANQLYIVPHDLKALSAAMAKAKRRVQIRLDVDRRRLCRPGGVAGAGGGGGGGWSSVGSP
jgi:hypothetical protein